MDLFWVSILHANMSLKMLRMRICRYDPKASGGPGGPGGPQTPDKFFPSLRSAVPRIQSNPSYGHAHVGDDLISTFLDKCVLIYVLAYSINLDQVFPEGRVLSLYPSSILDI